MEKLLYGHLLQYTMIGLAVLGIMFKIVQTIVYIHLIGESENVPASRNKLIKQMKLKFENSYKLNLGVNNVEAFVDKYMYKHKICGINLYYFKRFPIIAGWVSGAIGILCGLICYWQNYSLRMGAMYEIYGIGSILILKFADIVLDTAHKKRMVYVNLIDFFENSLMNHLNHDLINPSVLTEEEREILEELPIIREAKASESKIVPYIKKDKTKSESTKELPKEEANAIIQDVINQFLT